MVEVAKKLNGILSLREFLAPFIYSRVFPIIISLIALSAYQVGLWQLGLALYVFFFCAILLIFEDITPTLPIICTFAFIFGDLSVFSSVALYIILAPAAVCLVAHFFFYPAKFRFGEMFLPLILVSIAMLIGGLGSFYTALYLNGFSTIIGCGVMLLAIYLIFTNSIRPPKDFDLKLYLIDVLIIVALSCAAELCLKYLTIYLNNGQFDNGKIYQFSSMGWGHTNCVASLILLATPLCFYRITKTDMIFPWLILLAFFYVSAYVSRSDGAFFLMLLLSPVYVVFTLIRMKSYKRVHFALYVLLIITLCWAAASLFLDFGKLIEKFKDLLYNDSGRTPLYTCAVYCFMNNPIFGVGLGFYNDVLMNPVFYEFGAVTTFNFHSVLFEVMATMGIVGLVVYVYYYYKRLRILGRTNSDRNFFLTLAFLGIELYAFIDTCEFIAVPTMIILTLMVAFTERGNETKTADFPLGKKFRLNFKKF